MEKEGEPFTSSNKSNLWFFIDEGTELKSLTICLNWVFQDQPNIWITALSWSIFLLLAIGVPIVSHFALLCSNCDSNHQRPYDAVVQLSLSTFAIVSFFSLFSWSRKYGVRRFLFLDKLDDQNERIRREYKQRLHVCFVFQIIFFLLQIYLCHMVLVGKQININLSF